MPSSNIQQASALQNLRDEFETIHSFVTDIPGHFASLMYKLGGIKELGVDTSIAALRVHLQFIADNGIVIGTVEQLVALRTEIWETENRVFNEDLDTRSVITVAEETRALGEQELIKGRCTPNQTKYLQQLGDKLREELRLHCPVDREQTTTGAMHSAKHNHIDPRELKKLVVGLRGELFMVEKRMLQNTKEKGLKAAAREVQEAGYEVVRNGTRRHAENVRRKEEIMGKEELAISTSQGL